MAEMNQGGQPYIFAGFAPGDWERVCPILEKLRDQGLRVRSERDLKSDEEPEDAAQERPEQCGGTLVFLTGRYLESEGCRELLRRMRERGTAVVSVFLEDAALPAEMQEEMAGLKQIRLGDLADEDALCQALLEEDAFRRCVEQSGEKHGYESEPYVPEPPRTFLETVELTGTDYARLLGSGMEPDMGEVRENPMDTSRKVLFIGLGGMGVKTLNRLKEKVEERFGPAWKEQVAFLAVDTDYDQLRHAEHLNLQEECFFVGESGIQARIQDPETRPVALERILRNDASLMDKPALHFLNNAGTSGSPVVGKVKLYDQAPKKMSVDEQLVHKIGGILGYDLAPLPRQEFGQKNQICDVYVIASGCGGTGAGMFLEMPALLRRIRVDYHLYGVLYLPDVFPGMNKDLEERMQANCYALLKEWNYYQAEAIWGNDPPTWPSNNSVVQMPEQEYHGRMYDSGYLVGAVPGHARNSFGEVSEELVETLVQTLEKAVPSRSVPWPTPLHRVLGNANKHRKPIARNEARKVMEASCEFPPDFVSVGFASAEVDQAQVRAYKIREVLREMGLSGANGSTGPYLDRNGFRNAAEGTIIARELLAPLEALVETMQLVGQENNPVLSELRTVSATEAWTRIRNGSERIEENLEQWVKERTNAASAEQLIRQATKAMGEFRKNVADFVAKEGPFAFANVFKGIFRPIGAGKTVDYGTGIHQMIRNLMDGKQTDGAALAMEDPSRCRERLDAITQEIRETSFPFNMDLRGRRASQVQEWMEACQKLIRSRVIQFRWDTMMGDEGVLKSQFLKPAERLCLELESFGELLCGISKVYEASGGLLEQEDLPAKEGCFRLDLLRLHPVLRKQIERETQETVTRIDMARARKYLVDDFFADPEQWLYIAPDQIRKDAFGKVQLVDRDKPILAGSEFAHWVRCRILPDEEQISVRWIFQTLHQSAGMSYGEALHMVMQKLTGRSQPCVNVGMAEQWMEFILTVPQWMTDTEEISRFIHGECRELGINFNSGLRLGWEDDRITVIACSYWMELYRLQDLKTWEHSYENQIAQGNLSLLHGKSQDLAVRVDENGRYWFTERQSWADYPAITLEDDREAAPGRISRERRHCQEMEELVAEAKRLGVMELRADIAGGWCIAFLNPACDTVWQFDAASCIADERGLIPLNGTLPDQVNRQNGGALERMWDCLRGGLYEPEQKMELAWRTAARILRINTKQRRAVQRVVAMFRDWEAEVKFLNVRLMGPRRPMLFAELMRSGIVTLCEDGRWIFYSSMGETVTLYSVKAMAYSNGEDKTLLDQNMMCFVAYRKLMEQLDDDRLWAESIRARSLLEQWLENDNMKSLNALAKQLQKLEAEQKAAAKLLSEEQPDEVLARQLNVSLETAAEVRNFYRHVLNG